MKRQHWWSLGLLAIAITALVGIRSFRNSTVNDGYLSEAEDIEAGLTLRDVTLEQQDDEGQLLWRVHAREVTYSPDKKIANLVQPEGELYRDGEILYRVKADEGVIRDNGQVIDLSDNIIANGTQNKMRLRGENLTWFPEDSIMIIKNGISGTHPQVQAQAKTARVYDQEKRVEFEGDVVATTVVDNPDQEPWIKMQSSSLEWKWEQEQILSSEPIKVERFEQRRITEVLTGKQAAVDLAKNQITMTENIQATLLDVPLTMSSEKATWDLEKQTIKADHSIKVVNPKQKVVITANRGELNLASETAYFVDEVLASSTNNSEALTANTLTWNLSDQTILAEGNVEYQQINPQIIVRGPRARGRIEEQTVIVDGGQVVTEIVPPSN